MEKKLIILLAIGLLLWAPLLPKPALVSDLGRTTDQLSTPAPERTQPAAARHDDLLRTNIMQNPSFESAWSAGQPAYYSYFGSLLWLTNSSYRDHVHSGTQAGQLIGEASTTTSCYAGMPQDLGTDEGNVSQTQILDVNYYIEEQGPIQDDAYTYIFLETTNSSDYSIYLYYVISYGSHVFTNSTNYLYIRTNSTAQTWHNLHRNVTADLIDHRSYLGSDMTRRIVRVSVRHYAPMSTFGVLSVVVDDFSLTNGTGYESIDRGDFEGSPTSAWGSHRYSPAYFGQSTDSTDMMYSANLSVSAVGENTGGYAAFYKSFGNDPDGSYYPFDANSITVQFDWKYSDTYNGGAQNAFVYFSLYNGSNNFYLYYMLGQDLNKNPAGNGTNYFHFNASNFGTHDQWSTFRVELNDTLSDIGISHVMLRELRFYVSLGSRSNSSVELLVDNFRVEVFI
ncbi:MAG: hypothetical protein ACTSPE_13390 [Candidatus Thorarchaeota archaeon]